MRLNYNDEKHQYRLDGKLVKGATTVCDVGEDKYQLEKWAERMVGIGIAENPDLAKKLLEVKDKPYDANGITWIAKQRAGASKAADRGTEMHQIIEDYVKGITSLTTMDSFSRALCSSFDRACREAGVEVLPEYTERIIVHPDVPLAGRIDHIFKVKRSGKLAIADVKSGKRAVEFPHKIAKQLGIYANAPLMADPLDEDGFTESFTPMPDKLDKKWAYIVHTPDEDNVSIVKVDIKFGWDLVSKHILPLIEARTRGDLVVPVATQAIDLGPASDERIAWIRGRLGMISMLENADAAKKLVGERWPADIATPKSGLLWSDADVDALDVMLASVEKEASAGFPTRDPAFSEQGAM